MKVLVISSLYERPGTYTGQHVHHLCRELATWVDLRVVCPLPRFDRKRGIRDILAGLKETVGDRVQDGVRVRYLPYANVPHGLSPRWAGHRLYRSLARQLEPSSWRPDLIHAHWLFPTGWAGIRLGRQLAVPVLVTAHGSDVHTHPRRSRRLAEATADVIESADRLTAVSGELANALQALGSPRRPVAPIHSGVDTSRFRSTGTREENRKRLGLPLAGVGLVSVSRLHQAKGVADLLEAFARIRREHAGTWLALVGDGPARTQVQSRALELGIEKSVFLAGARANAEVPFWLCSADLFVLASHAEGLPTAVLEAMACGLPVVATRVGGTEEAVADAGILVPPLDVAALVAALGRLVRLPDARLDLGKSARDRVQSHFSVQRAAQDYLALYEEMTGMEAARRQRQVQS